VAERIISRCKTCEFWKKYSDNSVNPGIPKGYCECPKIDYELDIKVSDEVTYGDSESWSAYLIMGADFGCVHHKEKEQ
jgi:hypothetical protein